MKYSSGIVVMVSQMILPISKKEFDSPMPHLVLDCFSERSMAEVSL